MAPFIRVTDKSLVWNSDLIETLEFDNLIVQAAEPACNARFRAPREMRYAPRRRSRRILAMTFYECMQTPPAFTQSTGM